MELLIESKDSDLGCARQHDAKDRLSIPNNTFCLFGSAKDKRKMNLLRRMKEGMGSASRHRRSDVLSLDRTADIALLHQVEHDDGKFVVHAKRNSGRIHHL